MMPQYECVMKFHILPAFPHTSESAKEFPSSLLSPHRALLRLHCCLNFVSRVSLCYVVVNNTLMVYENSMNA